MLKNEGDRLSRVVVCTPEDEYFKAVNLKTHNINEIADPDRTHEQHGRLKSIISGSGCEVVDMPELAGHPNSVFTRDVSLVTPEGYIKLRMGIKTRRGEEQWMSQILESLGESCAGEIKAPGTVEGGDIFLAGSTAFIGLSKRTNTEGAHQISRILEGMNYEVRIFPVKGNHLHLGGVMSLIAPDKVLCCRGMFPEVFFQGFDVIETADSGPSCGNVICLDKNVVIANTAENMETINILESSGVKVIGIDLSEFRKGAGGPTCLILPVERK
ncbi:dimethylarginine dimethylaminohydrolase family protein [candidate division KSB1 bacterium]